MNSTRRDESISTRGSPRNSTINITTPSITKSRSKRSRNKDWLRNSRRNGKSTLLVRITSISRHGKYLGWSCA